MGEIIDFCAKLQERRERQRKEEGEKTARVRLQQDFLIALSANPLVLPGDIAECLWSDFGVSGELLAEEVLKELLDAGLISLDDELGWALSKEAERIVDDLLGGDGGV